MRSKDGTDREHEERAHSPAITKAAAGLMAQAEQTASQIDASDGSYGETDNTAATDLYHSGSGLGQH